MKITAILTKELFWLSLFVFFPLTLNPYAFTEGAERAIFMPRAALLLAIWIVGIVALLLNHSDITFASLPSQMNTMPRSLKILLAFLIFLLISTWFGIGNFSVNMIGSILRFDGTLVQAAWYSLALVSFGLIVSQRHDLQRIFSYVILGACLASVWTIAQAYGLEPIHLFVDISFNENRIAYGPMALTGLTAAYLAVVFTVYIVYRPKLDGISFIVCVLFSIALIATGNRTAPAAFVVVMLATLAYAIFKKEYSKVRFLFFVVVILILSVFLLRVTRSDNVGNLEQITRTGQLISGNDTSLQVRLAFWQAALRSIPAQPIFGFGPNGFNYVFWTYATEAEQYVAIRPKLPPEASDVTLTGTPFVYYKLPDNENFIREIVNPDKVHNNFLDIAVASGIPSVLLYVAAVLSGVVAMLRSGSRMARAIALATVVYMLFGITWFATLQVDPIFWSLFGIGVGTATQPQATLSIGHNDVAEL